MRYSLWCEEKGVGDSGPMSEILDPENNYKPIPNVSRPKIGCGVRVGSYYSRSFAAQDWWQTSPITEILEERADYIKFKTRNSIYEWKII